jgi:predicted DNA-binding antitoxin AbrB/MazE fold protein
MGEIIEVIYENGVLKPLKPLKLKEGQRLRVRILSTGLSEFIKSVEDKLERPEKDPLEILTMVRE